MGMHCISNNSERGVKIADLGKVALPSCIAANHTAHRDARAAVRAAGMLQALRTLVTSIEGGAYANSRLQVMLHTINGVQL